MKEKMLAFLKLSFSRATLFAKQNPKLALFLFGIVIGLLISFVF